MLNHISNIEALHVEPTVHPYAVWNGDTFDSRYSNVAAAAERVKFLGSGYWMLDESTGKTMNHLDCCKYRRPRVN